MRTISGMVLTVGLLAVAFGLRAQTTFDPHGDPQTGVLRVATDPPSRGECTQCHPSHGDSDLPEPQPPVLFAENTNQLAFWDEGESPCHRRRPDNYPLTESDRMPETAPDPGYFEANTGGERRSGVNLRGRWPGERIYTDPDLTPGGKYFSPHAQDPDMPRKDPGGEGSCLNCHDPHEGVGLRDLLVAPYGAIGGHAAVGAPTEYGLCLDCHGRGGPPGMDLENRFLADYYDAGLNGRTAGHQIRRNPAAAIYWPPHVQAGDMLPCYDCHNPHGSEGSDGVRPNAFLISDERPEWAGLTNTLTDPAQTRRFCWGCHIPSDGIPGIKQVGGIIMNAISNREPHRSSSTRGCYDCHGNDYTDPESENVHRPRARVG